MALPKKAARKSAPKKAAKKAAAMGGSGSHGFAGYQAICVTENNMRIGGPQNDPQDAQHLADAHCVGPKQYHVTRVVGSNR